MSSLTLEIVRGTRRTVRAGADWGATYISRLRDEALAEAERLVEDARDEARRLLDRARSEAFDVHLRAARSGAEVGERKWAEAAIALAERRTEALENLERDCVHLAVEIARQIIGEALRVDGRLVESIAESACARLRADAALSLKVGPAHAERAAALRARLGAHRAVVVLVDGSLGDADCVAECAGVRVDARLEVQLANVERRLLGTPASEVAP
jgi:flagellar biosynthesis/type III secretory pathway protein FliH